MSVPVVLYLRSNIDWRTMTDARFAGQRDDVTSTQPMSTDRLEKLIRSVRMWNDVFPVSYFEYRQRLREIAELNWLRMRGICVVIREQQFHSLFDQWGQCIVLPVDEDDWFHPDLAERLPQLFDPAVDVYHWDDFLYRPVPFLGQEPDHEPIRRRKWASSFGTNSYAIASTSLRKLTPVLRQQVLLHHEAAGELFCRPGFRRHYIDECLSLSHKSPASTLHMEHFESQASLTDWPFYLSRRLEPIPADLQWAADSIGQAERLLGRLDSDNDDSKIGPSARSSGSRVSVAATASASKPIPSVVATRARPQIRLVDVVNYLIEHRGFLSYLEMGYDTVGPFNQVLAPYKVAVANRPGEGVQDATEEFFAANQSRFDVIVINGLHLQEQVLIDVEQARGCLRSGGCILINACLPTTHESQLRTRLSLARPWMGDVWKAVVQFRRRRDCDVAVLDVGAGVGLLFERENSRPTTDDIPLTWEAYAKNRDDLLNIKSIDDMKTFVGIDA